MFTILLAWINAKYKYHYDGLFFATVFLDFMLITGIVSIFLKFQ